MKRFHVHIAVDDLGRSVAFYSNLFATQPTVLKTDYAKWMLDDPRVNFAISARGAPAGVEHLGIQSDDDSELADLYGRLARADGPVREEGATTCCYMRSEKSWITDPAGVPWEMFRSFGESEVFGGGATAQDAGRAGGEQACCTPQTPQGACCPPKGAKAASEACCA